jgi:hypothetical protein
VTAPDGSVGDYAPSQPPHTGDPRIDGALAALADAGDAPPDQLVGPLTEADRALRETLDAIGDD